MGKAKYTKGADGRFRTHIRTGQFDANGKEIEARLSARSSAELERKVWELRQSLKTEKKPKQIVLFGEYAEQYVQIYKSGKSIKTREMYENILRLHVERIADMPINEITKDDIQRTINDNEKYPRICEQTLCLIRQVLDNALENHLIEYTPCAHISLPRHVKKDTRALTEAEKETILNADYTAQERAFIFLHYYTGMRPAEIYALTWDDITDVISVDKALQFENSRDAVLGLTKTDSSIRELPIAPALQEALGAYKKVCKTHILFADGDNYMSRSAYRSLFDRCLKKAFNYIGKYTNQITPYMFRHNFCTTCRRLGMSLETCQMLMGHSSAKMVLEVYSHAASTDESAKLLQLM